jgi:hypothetical protein
MPRWKITVADIYTTEVEADTEDEACALAKDANETCEYDTQRIQKVERLLDDPVTP